ncbi:MAG: hypothetical protein AVDCRST_MAG68-1125, partial [uncultured Gemmatimonadetes bacterium]
GSAGRSRSVVCRRAAGVPNSGAHTETQRHRERLISVPLCLCV